MNKKLVQIAFTLDEYKDLQNLALNSNMNISDFIKSNTLPNYKGIPYYIEIAKEKVNALNSNVSFTLPLLFSDEWNTISRSTKISLGKDFYRQVTDNNIKNIIAIHKDSSNMQIYKKMNL